MATRKRIQRSGFSAKELFQRGLGIAYDDFNIINTRFSDLDTAQISLETTLGRGFSIKTPIIASPMDTVTSAELCIALALEGGVGVIHYNHKNDGKPNIDQQIAEISKVKRHENGFINEPVTVSPNETIEDVIRKSEDSRVGKATIDTFPVTQDGSSNGLLVGLLRKQDYSRREHLKLKVGSRMVTLEKLVYARLPITLEKANKMLWDEHLLYLPIVDKNGNLKYLVTRTDIDKNEMYPLATKDSRKRLRVMFAVDTRPECAYERLERGFDAGADGVVVDTSQGFTAYARNMLEYIAKKYPDKLLMGGNTSTSEAAIFLSNLGVVNNYRCGQGAGSICTTIEVLGIGRAGASGVYESARAVRNKALVTIADGGIKKTGHIVKALTIGGDAVMLGGMLAGTLEAPGEVREDHETGQMFKDYWGMGSNQANVGGRFKRERGYGVMEQGGAGVVPYKGSMHDWIPSIRDSLLKGMQALGCRNLEHLHNALYRGEIRFERKLPAAMKEAGFHLSS